MAIRSAKLIHKNQRKGMGFCGVNILVSLLLFGTTRGEYYHDTQEWENYVAASTSDLSRLFNLEKDLIASMDKFVYENTDKPSAKEDVTIARDALDQLKVSSWKHADSLTYVSHPVNAYSLVKRTATLWSNLLEDAGDDLDEVIEDIVIKFPMVDDFEYGAAVGLVNLELYYDGNNGSSSFFDLLSDGIIRDPKSGRDFHAHHNLTHEDFLVIADAARRVWRFDKYVEWRQAAYDRLAKGGGSTDLELKKVKKLVREAEEFHDKIIIERGINAIAEDGAPDGQPSSPMFTKTRPYNEEYAEIPSYIKARNRFKKEREISQPFVDLRPLDAKKGKYMEKSFVRTRTSMLPLSKRLCNGDRTLRPAEHDLDSNCILLHYGNPYLRLGPFKYEILNRDPHVAMFRDFYGSKELDDLVLDSKDKLHSTTYLVHGEQRWYTSQRSSKRRHLYDEDHPTTRKASRRISLATRWSVHQNPWSSEHYHLINYGIGGQIEAHVDHWGIGVHDHPGGARVVTFLGYASEPDLVGGRTIFPGLGLFVDPHKGDGIFWQTSKEDAEFDSRMFHMGCPVIYGSKWVLTKWLYADDQMWTHNCKAKGQPGKNFPPFDNSMRHGTRFTLASFDEVL